MDGDLFRRWCRYWCAVLLTMRADSVTAWLLFGALVSLVLTVCGITWAVCRRRQRYGIRLPGVRISWMESWNRLPPPTKEALRKKTTQAVP